ncbi:MAG: winged helix DNA-binding domain-containing protein [Thermomicrobiales bacterium]|nr:winged helix DNA-binding domain-containing protein [Thermomicrobiales bacterium]
MMQLTKREAQALAVIASRLDRRHFTRTINPDDILETITHLGMIQLDTISVVSRSHETALWSRLGNYNLDHLTTLFTERRALTEYLTHAAAITPTTYMPLLRQNMMRYPDDPEYWSGHRGEIRDRILERIYAEGAVGSRSFESPKDAARLAQWESWYGNKPEREILFALHAQGDVLVSLRDRSFGRWYDLPERVAPEHWHIPALTGEELQRTLLSHAMRSLGVATAPWLTDYWRTGGHAYVPNNDVRRLMPSLAEEGCVIPVSVDGLKDDTWLDASLLPTLESLREGSGWPTKTTFLSPFDNLIWNRDRMEQLWDMYYRLEIYTPAAKRVYGYYTMPILHRGRLVGLIDPSMNRKDRVLTIRALHLWKGVKPTVPLARAIAKTLDEFTAFLGGTDWYVLQSNPPEFAMMVTDG